MASKANSFIGITSGTAITNVSQTGGSSGDQFDTLTLTGTGVGITADVAADLTAAYDRGIICNLNTQTNATAALSWNITAANVTYHRMYYRSPTTTPNTNLRLALGLNGTTRVWELRHITSGAIALIDFNAGTTLMQTTALGTSTIYRIEWKAALTDTASDIQVYVGENTTGALGVTRFGNGITSAFTTWNSVRMGAISSSTAYTGSATQIAGVGYSDTGFMGPVPLAPVVPTYTVWNGSSEVAPSGVKVWNGSAEVNLSLIHI